MLFRSEKAYRLYKKYCEQQTGIKAVKLPSSSPANAIFTLDRLAEAWSALIYGSEKNEKQHRSADAKL